MAWELFRRNLNYWRFRFPQVVLLGTTGTISGTALPLSFIKLCPGGPSTTANGAGDFILSYVPIGTYRIISTSADRAQQGSEDIEVATDSTTTVNFTYSSTNDPGCP